jgi:hypothetical protein
VQLSENVAKGSVSNGYMHVFSMETRPSYDELAISNSYIAACAISESICKMNKSYKTQ